MKQIVLLLWMAALALALPQQKAEIRGVVLEPGTNLAVADAEISLDVQGTGRVRLNGGWEPDPTRKTRTDFRGAFRLPLDKPGAYRVTAKKDGYQTAGTAGGADFAEVALTTEKPAADVKLFLARFGRITGMVLDAQSGKPLGGVKVKAVSAKTFWPVGDSPAKSDAKGEFVVSALPPGEYAVEIGRQTGEEGRVLAKFTEADAKTVDEDFEHTYWPGGHGREGALPVTVASGATVSVGRLTAKKAPYYRVLVRVPAASCKPGETMSITEWEEGLGMHPLAQTPCDRDLLVTGFAPGAYRLIFGVRDREPENRATASVPFSIADRNLEIAAALHLPVAVEGVFTAADGARPADLTKVRVGLSSMDHVGDPDGPIPKPPDPDGKFRFDYVRPLPHMLLIVGLSGGHYVKEVRYNSIPLSGDIVPIDDGAAAHSLKIVIDDKPGTITGSVMSGDKPVSQPVVIARRWPPDNTRIMTGWALARGDDAGRFQMSVIPGEYRVIALRTVTPGMGLEGPAAERLFAVGKKVEVGAMGTESVSLELTELK